MKNMSRYLWVFAGISAFLTGSHAMAEPLCSEYASHEVLLQMPILREISGLTISSSNPRYFWGLMDGGGKTAVYLINRAGAVVQTYEIRSVTNVDWEDLDIGPCEPGSSQNCIYISDMGNNNRKKGQYVKYGRPNLAIYSIVEPDVSGELEFGAVKRVSYKKKWNVTYPEIEDPNEVGFEVTNPDCESIMVSPEGEIYFVSKQTHSKDLQRLFHLIRTGDDSGKVEELGALDFTSTAGSFSSTFNAVTSADFAPDGTRFAVRTYAQLYEFDLDEYPDMAEAFQHPRMVHVSAEMQGESLTYDRDGRSFVTAQEAFPRKTGISTMTFLTCDNEGMEPGDDLETITGESQSDYSYMNTTQPDPEDEEEEEDINRYYELICTPVMCETEIYSTVNGECPSDHKCSGYIGLRLVDTSSGTRVPIPRASVTAQKLSGGFELTETTAMTDNNGQLLLEITAGDLAESGEVLLTTDEEFDSKSVTIKVKMVKSEVSSQPPEEDPKEPEDPEDPEDPEEPDVKPEEPDTPSVGPDDKDPKPDEPVAEEHSSGSSSESCQGMPMNRGGSSSGWLILCGLLGLCFGNKKLRRVMSRKAN